MSDECERVLAERVLRRRVIAGDQDAWRYLYEHCFDSLYAYVCHRFGRDSQRAEDVVQECWMVAVRRIRSFDADRGSFRAWLRGVADNVIRNEQRRWARKLRKELRGGSADDVDAAQRTAGEGDLELAEQLSVTFAALPDHYRGVLRAKYEEGLTVAEIAQRSGATRKGTESLLQRARAEFQRVYAALDAERPRPSLADGRGTSQ